MNFAINIMENKLVNKEAMEKLREMVKAINTCMFCTNLSERPISTRPMAVREVDEEGNIWFISSSFSIKNSEIEEDNIVQLLFAKPSSSRFLSLYGSATIYKDSEKIKALWTPIANAWFEEGKNDPEVSLLMVKPEEAYYWDTTNGKALTLLKMATAAVTGKKVDVGEKGSLDLK